MISDPEPAQAQATSINVQAVQGGSNATTDDIRSYSADINWVPNYSVVNYRWRAKYRWSISDSNGKEVQTTPLANLSNSTVSFDVDWSDYGVGEYDVCAYGQVYNSEGQLNTEDNSCTSITVEEGEGEGEPDSCTSETVSGETVTATISSSLIGGSTGVAGTDENRNNSTQTIVFSDYISGDEYVDAVSFTADLYGITNGACSSNTCELESRVEALSEQVFFDEEVSFQYSSYREFSESRVFSASTDHLEEININYFVRAKTGGIDIPGETNNVTVDAEVTDIELSICEDASNIPPVAMPDGSVSNPIPVQFETPIYLDVMGDSYSGQDYDLDNGPDTPLVITQASSGYGSTANKAYGGSEVYYYPGTLDYGDTDQVSYTISDGADTDTATAYIKIVEKTGTVTFNNPDLDDGQAAVNPSWEGPEEFGWTPISDVYQFTVTLDEEAKLFSVPRNENHVRVLDGSRQLVDGDDWITKEVPVQDLTTNDWSALLGRTYTEYLNQSPVAEIGLVTFDSGCQGGAPCTLEMSNESTDPDGDPLTYNWDFDNGNESTAETPTQTYANNGTYNVKLTANDGELSHTDTCKITLGSEAPGGHEANCGSFILGVNETPTASINLTQLDSNGADHEYQFDASGSSDPDGFIASYEWEVINIVNSSGGAVSIYSFIDSSATVTDGTFTNPHDDTTITYTAQLTVTDDDGYTGTATRDIDVTCNEVFGGGTSACVSVSGP